MAAAAQLTGEEGAPDRAGASGSRFLTGAAALAATFSIAAALVGAFAYDLTVDEPFHLGWSRRLLESGETERESELHFNSKTPVTMANVAARKLAKRATSDQTTLRAASRLPTVAMLAVLLATTAAVGAALGGRALAGWALLLTALDPSLIAHGALATVDVPYAMATLLTLFAGLRLAERPAWPRALALGAALGLAFSTKFTAVLLLAGLLFLPLARPAPRAALARLAGFVALAGGVAAFVVCAAYLFQQFGVQLGEVGWRSGPFSRLARLLPGLWLPLPRDFLTGIDIVLGSEREKPFPVMILGERHPSGVWYYFAVVALLKTPLLTLAALAGGAVLALRGGLLRQPRARFLVANLVLTLAYFSLVFRMQIGYRFVLMCVPVVALVAASGLARLPARWSRAAAVAVLLAGVAENAPYLGNSLAFTNAAVRPKSTVYLLLADSNVDFGQNDGDVGAWIDRWRARGAHLDPVHLLPGDNIVNFNLASGAGPYHPHRWTRAQRLRPVDHFRHTWLLFRIGPEEFERLLSESRRLVPAAATACGGGEGGAAAGPRRIALEAETVLLCLTVEQETDVVLRGLSGTGTIGPADRSLREWDRIRAGSEAWYRLAPGRHALAASGRLEWRWEPRGPAPRLVVRPARLEKGYPVAVPPQPAPAPGP